MSWENAEILWISLFKFFKIKLANTTEGGYDSRYVIKNFKSGTVRNRGNTKHNLAGTSTYVLWQRLRIKNDLIPEWHNSFESFYSFVGARPQNMYLNKYNVNKLHSPENTFWGNKSMGGHLRFLEYNNEIKLLKDWAAYFGISKPTLYKYLKRNYSLEEIGKKFHLYREFKPSP